MPCTIIDEETALQHIEALQQYTTAYLGSDWTDHLEELFTVIRAMQAHSGD